MFIRDEIYWAKRLEASIELEAFLGKETLISTRSSNGRKDTPSSSIADGVEKGGTGTPVVSK
jgi:hypothetical protein